MRQATLLAGLLALVALAGCLEGLPREDGPGGPGPGEAPPGLGAFVSSSPFETAPPAGNLTVEQVDIGQGDGIVLHFPDGDVVVDAGPWYGDGETAVRDHLAAEGAHDLRALVVTHPDADHAGGCDEILEAHDPAVIVHPGSSRDTRTWRDCQEAIGDEPGTVLTDAALDPGHYLNLSYHASTRVLEVDADVDDPNDGSVVLRVTYGDVRVDLTGDIPCSREGAILDRGFAADVDVLKVAHHGSSSSTCGRWLEATTPEVGLVGVGADNAYGHPHDEVLDRLADHGVDVYRTDLHGTVAVTTDGQNVSVRTGRSPDGTEEEASANATDVHVSAVEPDAPGDDHENPNGEWVEVTNGRNETADLAGWTLSDEADHTYTFPDTNHTTLEPGAGVKVRTGSGNDNSTDLHWGRDRAVWNNGGDTATLRDAGGALVDERSW